MNIQTLIRQLSIPSLRWLHMGNPETAVYFFEEYDSHTDCLPNILYIGKLSELPPLPEGDYTFICVRDCSEAGIITSHLIPENCNIISLPEGQSLDSLSEQLTHIFQEAARYVHYSDILLRAMNGGKSLQEMTELISSLIGNPVYVIDTGYSVLAMSREKIPERPDLEVQRQSGYMEEINILHLREDNIFEKIRREHAPCYVPIKDEPGWLHTLVYLHGMEVGEVAVMERNRRISQNDIELVQLFTQFVANILQNDVFYQQNRNYMHSILIAELLDKKIPSSAVAAYRMKQIKWKVTDYLRLMVVFNHHSNNSGQNAHIIGEQISRLFRECHYAGYGTDIVFLFTDDAAVRETLHSSGRTLKEYLIKNELTAAVSMEYSDLLNTPHFYEQCRIAGALGTKKSPSERLFFYEDYMMDHISEILAAQGFLADFYHPAALAIKKYDRENQTEYEATLKTLLDCADSYSVAAGMLNIHKNTLAYRINKMKELFHLNMNDGEEKFRIRLSFYLME